MHVHGRGSIKDQIELTRHYYEMTVIQLPVCKGEGQFWLRIWNGSTGLVYGMEVQDGNIIGTIIIMFNTYAQ